MEPHQGKERLAVLVTLEGSNGPLSGVLVVVVARMSERVRLRLEWSVRERSDPENRNDENNVRRVTGLKPYQPPKA